MAKKVTFLCINIMLAFFCSGQSIIGNWRKVIPVQSNSLPDTTLHSGDLAIRSDSTFIMYDDKLNITGTWTTPSKNRLAFWCDPKKDMLKIHLSIIKVTENELVLKLNSSRIKYIRL